MKNRISVIVIAVVLFTCINLAAAPVFKEVCRQLAESEAHSSVVTGEDGWLFLKEELGHIGLGQFWGEKAAEVSRAKNKKHADPVPAIVKYNKMLAEKGITLYLLPVPPKALVYPDKVAAEISVKDAEPDQALYQQMYDILREKGVQVVDLLPTLLEARETDQLYCKTDTHFSGPGLDLFAKAVAEIVKKEPWYSEVSKSEFTSSTQQVTIQGDLSQMKMQKQDPKSDQTGSEELALSIVNLKDSQTPVESDPKSPVILLGDSHTLVFSAGGDLHAKGAGLFDHLSAELGFPVDLLGVRGSGVTPARIKFYQRSKKDSAYLDGKKALIWCFTARDFTGTGGWRDIPVAP